LRNRRAIACRGFSHFGDLVTGRTENSDRGTQIELPWVLGGIVLFLNLEFPSFLHIPPLARIVLASVRKKEESGRESQKKENALTISIRSAG
jgi:hypothetical protein